MAIGDLVSAAVSFVPTMPTVVETFFGFIFGMYAKHVLWVHHVAISNLNHHDRGVQPSWVLKVFTEPVKWTGRIVDVGYNAVVGSALFMDIPRELTFRKRCNRYLSTHSAETKRFKIASWFDDHFLMPLDPNRRIK